jgi:hypothetical protein
MTNRRVALSGLVATAVAFAGACSDITPTDPVGFDQDVSLFGGSAPDPSAFPGGLDAQFVRIAQQNPGFGGFFYEDGALNIVTTGVQPMSSRLAASLARMGIDPTAQPVRVVQGQYDFVQLASMRAQVNSLFSINGVVFTDADEKLNRVHVGVENAAARADVERGLDMLGVPREAVVISITDPIEPMQSLQSRVRPVAGGLQINFPGFLCTLGFNVRGEQHPNVQGFVTNSHCTSTRGVMTGTPYWQPSSGTPDSFIGNEAHDLPFFTGGICPVGRQCRWSDAAGVRYDEGVDIAFGRVYRTTGLGSLTIDSSNPQWTIVAERPFPNVGDILHKTGRTTGWTSGSVSQTCVDTGVSGTTITMLCQDWVLANVAGGDSGSPVFSRLGAGADSDIRLEGVLWGGGTGVFVFSAMDNVRFENVGPAPWITFPGQSAP